MSNMECKHSSTVLEDGQHVCIDCATILDQYIDEGAEWRQYEDHKGEDQGRTGFATSELLPTSSYGSVVSYRGISSSNTMMKSIQRLSCWSLFSNSERSWMGIFDAIQISCNHVGLPKAITMEACGLYKHLEDAQKVRGETRRACMGAAVFVACRNQNASRTHEEIADMFQVNIRALCKAIGRYEQTDNTVLDTQIGLAERLCSTLNLNDQQRDSIMDMLRYIATKSEDEFEHTPKTIVAGVIASVMGLTAKAKMKSVSDASGVSVLSIHKIVSKLKTLQ
jgi:transcription initiation factor TFIIIB Brf1 subunit/transcription initiation factor TFIIB